MKNKLNYILLTSSGLCLLYILFLVYYSSYSEKNNIINFFAEILTIPVILVTAALFIFNILNLAKHRFQQAALNVVSLFLNIVTFAIMFFAK
ncbi:glucan phosphoethanolaminetransferase (alkaline phosphatase superfamily) [Chryseobacterium defluvii]|uniref:Glucan phosphoethanolaminetransferase (Alkaline phosphatase superfamily) n=1 Tax=Chryseobacterium defluvii TaxID=160396 RepID=A0A840KKW3_9FLAO|nr:hypothetical protein [Chryseobacterium defluvii]MBB4808133.1 glucan phosphoethanolaminetransferase (alkaline phosphatase superfamily) [Chryseobacterium defluvii]